MRRSEVGATVALWASRGPRFSHSELIKWMSSCSEPAFVKALTPWGRLASVRLPAVQVLEGADVIPGNVAHDRGRPATA